MSPAGTLTPGPVLRRGICLGVDPTGCQDQVRHDVAAITARLPAGGPRAPRSVLVVGASGGLGLAMRITAAFGMGAATVGVANGQPGTAGWYRTAALQKMIDEDGPGGRSVHGDAYAEATRDCVVEVIRRELGTVDLVVHSVAAPRRRHPETGEVQRSTIAAIGAPYRDLSYDAGRDAVHEVTLPAATERQVTETVAVLGGDDWRRWIDALASGGVLADGARTIAFTYVGPQFLRRSYAEGTLGAAKTDLEAVARELDERLARAGGGAYAVAAPALVTAASAVIPVQSLYAVLLHHALAQRGIALEPLDRAAAVLDQLSGAAPLDTDPQGRLRVDAEELLPDVQAQVRRAWTELAPGGELPASATRRYRAALVRTAGFGVPRTGSRPTDPRCAVQGLVRTEPDPTGGLS